ncbi:hypothetical protein NA66_102371 [Burkholderia pyrrocinia]|uniref:Uncharacterized protein n=1 Tax=Burkholderia pyrrocinia TaxID=60550 RepID=A0A318IH11_BURPY|nr:hypothetical protein NA66_102371 [Burkholderia pyrrocinia]SFW87237.1 hypothetical protein SAMN03159384_06416 [Burkholderia sp. NFACC33-1]SFY44218.1 hypothetical protein SAMN03159408_05767 [Burkholderia sp. NFPP32]
MTGGMLVQHGGSGGVSGGTGGQAVVDLAVFRVARISPTVAKPRAARSVGEPERPTKDNEGTLR